MLICGGLWTRKLEATRSTGVGCVGMQEIVSMNGLTAWLAGQSQNKLQQRSDLLGQGMDFIVFNHRIGYNLSKRRSHEPQNF